MTKHTFLLYSLSDIAEAATIFIKDFKYEYHRDIKRVVFDDVAIAAACDDYVRSQTNETSSSSFRKYLIHSW